MKTFLPTFLSGSVAAVLLALSGCATLPSALSTPQHDSAMVTGSQTRSLLGLGSNLWVRVSSIDGVFILSIWGLNPTKPIYLPPGKHVLGLEGNYSGLNLNGAGFGGFGWVDVDLAANHSYQLNTTDGVDVIFSDVTDGAATNTVVAQWTLASNRDDGDDDSVPMDLPDGFVAAHVRPPYDHDGHDGDHHDSPGGGDNHGGGPGGNDHGGHPGDNHGGPAGGSGGHPTPPPHGGGSGGSHPTPPSHPTGGGGGGRPPSIPSAPRGGGNSGGGHSGGSSGGSSGGGHSSGGGGGSSGGGHSGGGSSGGSGSGGGGKKP